MIVYAIVILSTIVVTAILDTVAEIPNLRVLSQELPEEFRDVYDEKEYALLLSESTPHSSSKSVSDSTERR